jgi:hypothetical protein
MIKKVAMEFLPTIKVQSMKDIGTTVKRMARVESSGRMAVFSKDSIFLG